MSILSDTITVEKPKAISTETIEDILITRYGNVLRWAIVAVDDKSLKISFSYEKKA